MRIIVHEKVLALIKVLKLLLVQSKTIYRKEAEEVGDMDRQD